MVFAQAFDAVRLYGNAPGCGPPISSAGVS